MILCAFRLLMKSICHIRFSLVYSEAAALMNAQWIVNVLMPHAHLMSKATLEVLINLPWRHFYRVSLSQDNKPCDSESRQSVRVCEKHWVTMRCILGLDNGCFHLSPDRNNRKLPTTRSSSIYSEGSFYRFCQLAPWHSLFISVCPYLPSDV